MKKTKVFARLGVRDDIPACVARSQEAYGLLAWDAWRFATYMACRNVQVQMLEQEANGPIVGHAIVVADRPTLLIQDLVIDRVHQRQGWASGWLHCLLERFSLNRRFQNVQYVVTEDNEPGQELLRHMGFKMVHVYTEFTYSGEAGLTFGLEL